MFLISAAGLDEDETLSTFCFLFAQRFALFVLGRERVGFLIHVFERGKNFTHVPFDNVEERGDPVKARER